MWKEEKFLHVKKAGKAVSNFFGNAFNGSDFGSTASSQPAPAARRPQAAPVASSSGTTVEDQEMSEARDEVNEVLSDRLQRRRLNSIEERDAPEPSGSSSTQLSQLVQRATARLEARPTHFKTVKQPDSSAASHVSDTTEQLARDQVVSGILGGETTTSSSPSQGEGSIASTARSVGQRTRKQLKNVLNPLKGLVNAVGPRKRSSTPNPARRVAPRKQAFVFKSQLYPDMVDPVLKLRKGITNDDLEDPIENEDDQTSQFNGKTIAEIREIIRQNYDPSFKGPQKYWKSAARCPTYWIYYELPTTTSIPEAFIQYLVDLDLAYDALAQSWHYSLLLPLAELCFLYEKEKFDVGFKTNVLLTQAENMPILSACGLYKSGTLYRVLEQAKANGTSAGGTLLSQIITEDPSQAVKTYRLNGLSPLLIAFSLRNLLETYKNRNECAPLLEPVLWRLENISVFSPMN